MHIGVHHDQEYQHQHATNKYGDCTSGGNGGYQYSVDNVDNVDYIDSADRVDTDITDSDGNADNTTGWRQKTESYYYCE